MQANMRNMNDSQRVVADAQHKEKAYPGLAREIALQGDFWLATHVQFLSDISSAIAIGGLNPAITGLDGNNMLATVLERLSGEFAGQDGRTIISLLRDQIELMLSATDAALWRKRLPFLDYLGDSIVTPDLLITKRTNRLGDASPADFIKARFKDADTSMDTVLTLLSNDQEKEAIAASFSSDLAAFEAWLITRSINCGDEILALTEIRWALGKAVLADMPPVDKGFNDAIQIVRSRLAWVAGPIDARDLARHLSRMPSDS
jgi:hypothetical protein